ncbi:MAG: hypothetical protein JSW48_00830 [Betaproteobacteria bacterium]|nr:MAG: hypothetical protein JSW48_00830 [Betaproteobacteria bacterium]
MAAEQTGVRSEDDRELPGGQPGNAHARLAGVSAPLALAELVKRRVDGGPFLVQGLQKVKAELVLAVTAHNLSRVINVLGTRYPCGALAT